MKIRSVLIRCLFLVFVLLLFTNQLRSQSIYEFQYQSPNNKAISPISALMFNFSEGGDFVRLHYYDSTIRKSVILNINLSDSIVLDNKGLENSQLLILKANSASKIRPLIETPVFNPDLYLLSAIDKNAYLNPSGIIKPSGIDSLHVTQLTIDSLTPKRMEYYFDKSESIYTQIMNADTRDDKKIPAGAIMHLILVADTEDEEYGTDFSLDKQKILYVYNQIAHSLNMPLHSLVIAGADFNKTTIKNRIDSFVAGPNDLIFFHYSGHGFSMNKSTDVFPYYFLEKNKSVPTDNQKKLNKLLVQASIDMLEMEDVLKKKGARSTFLFSDCCNNSILELPHRDNNEPAPKIRKKATSSAYLPNKCRALFYDKSYNILLAAAKKDQAAYSTAETGSYFTHNYLFTLQTALSIDNSLPLDWNRLLEKVKNNTTDLVRGTIKGSPIQNPIIVPKIAN